MSSTIDEITINYEEDGTLLVKEMDKEVLSKGLNSTILFRYKEYIADKDDYGPDKYTIRRYKKVAGDFRQQAKFNISSVRQARIIADTLAKWIAEDDAANATQCAEEAPF